MENQKEAYTIIQENISAVFASEDKQVWWRIVGPDGMLPQAYLTEEAAQNICDKKNQGYVDIEAIKQEARDKAEAKRLANV